MLCSATTVFAVFGVRVFPRVSLLALHPMRSFPLSAVLLVCRCMSSRCLRLDQLEAHAFDVARSVRALCSVLIVCSIEVYSLAQRQAATRLVGTLTASKMVTAVRVFRSTSPPGARCYAVALYHGPGSVVSHGALCVSASCGNASLLTAPAALVFSMFLSAFVSASSRFVATHVAQSAEYLAVLQELLAKQFRDVLLHARDKPDGEGWFGWFGCCPITSGRATLPLCLFVCSCLREWRLVGPIACSGFVLVLFG